MDTQSPSTEQTEALTDYRYIGSDPNNYVTFNNETWRIIGVFSVDDGTGNVEQRLKLIRNESIGYYSWDNTFPYGTNNWTDARLNYLLNEGHESEENGGSLYWNSGSGTCYYGNNNVTVPCDFTETGLGSNARNMIGDTLWYLGGSNGYSNITTSMYYERERGTTVYSGGDTSWVEKVGLMYPSDYGYATSGGTTTNRNSCLNETFNNWLDLSDCYTNNWLYIYSPSSLYGQWTLTSDSSSLGSPRTMLVTSNGWIISWRPNSVDELGSLLAIAVRPSVFLKSNVKIIAGDGSSSNPYMLSQNIDNSFYRGINIIGKMYYIV